MPPSEDQANSCAAAEDRPAQAVQNPRPKLGQSEWHGGRTCSRTAVPCRMTSIGRWSWACSRLQAHRRAWLAVLILLACQAAADTQPDNRCKTISCSLLLVCTINSWGSSSRAGLSGKSQLTAERMTSSKIAGLGAPWRILSSRIVTFSQQAGDPLSGRAFRKGGSTGPDSNGIPQMECSPFTFIPIPL